MSDFKSGQKVRLNDEDNIPYSPTNPLPVVQVESEGGAEIHDYNDSGDIAEDGTSDHDYTVTVGKELFLEKVLFAGSGAMKAELQVETAVASGVFDTIAVGFVQAGAKSDAIDLKRPVRVAAGIIVKVIKTNLDNDDQCLYSTIIGLER